MDCVCYFIVGISDVEILVLYIVVGDLLVMDVFLVYYNSIFFCYFVFLLGYGFYGDIIKDSEKKWWLGFVRYDFLGLKIFFFYYCYEGIVFFFFV